MKTLLFTFIILAFMQTPAALKTNDLDVLTGSKWKGSLTYLDYSSGKPEKIPVEITITIKSPGIYTWLTAFPLEPTHNSTDEVVISTDGKTFDGETVKESTQLPDGSLKIITETTGNDNNKPAIYHITYVFSKTLYNRKKEVCYTGETKFFTRNEYTLSR